MTPRRRGAILFEVLVAVALFAAVGVAVTTSMRSARAGLIAVDREQQAADLARSLMSALEMGETNINELREGLPRTLGSNDAFAEELDEALDRGEAGWSLDVRTIRSPHPDLTLVELTVRSIPPGSAPDSPDAAAVSEAVSFTLSQLLQLRETDPEAFEQDDILDDLPEPGDVDATDPGDFEDFPPFDDFGGGS